MLFETRLSHWGVVTAAELHASGVPDHRRDRWLATGELHRAGRGVYCFGSPPPGDGIWCQQAAVALAGAGPDALLAGPSAARLWQLDGFDSSVAIDVVVPLRCGRRGSNVRRVDVLDGPVVIDGLPTVGIVQTLVELGARAMSGRMRPDEVVEAALESALRRGMFEDASLGDRLGGSRSRRTGSGVLREVLKRRPEGTPPTESYLETRGIQVLRNGGVPAFDRQVELFTAEGRWLGRVDLYRDGVVVEFDGRAPHDPWFVRDRRRWTDLSAAGYRLAVFTWTDVMDQPESVVAATTSLLLQASRVG